ncbi:MAG: hypothetical protein OZ921_19690 [Sorangiineae bacterium]|nr:hypothetical protein [Polyangiaceae bacterium]MEB2324748.1 hypothetical protein [Sorangiineae bacterium]
MQRPTVLCPAAPTARRLVVALGALALAGACGGEPTARETFDANVLPVFQRSCAAAACHGVAPGAEARGEQIDWNQFYLRLDARGMLSDPDQAYATAKRVIDTTEDPEFSQLLRKPLGVRLGGLPHYGGENFSGTDDPAYRAVRDWISLEAGGGEDPRPLDELEQLFADTVQPVLVEATCMTSRCHGPTAGATPYHLDVGYRGRFPAAATRHNYEETLRMVTLDGDPLLSRVIRKAQPLGPGIVHKGTNFDFFAGDPGGGVSAITNWICAERRARAGEDCASPEAPPISGFVFVRGPISPHPAFELDSFTPGSDLFLATVDTPSVVPSSTENLTERLHPGAPADVRDPAVSRDGTRVVFSMRVSAEDGHHLWMLDLTSRAARQLTSGAGTDRDPTFGPDGSVWFVSTRAGVVADRGALLDADIYSLEPETGALRRWTYTPHVERKPVFFDIGDEAGGEVAFSALRDAIPDQARAHVFRFPPSQSTEYHQHFGITPVETFFYDMRELPDGRYVSVVGDLPAVWEAGGLGIIERNFGPELNRRAAESRPALELYEPPLVRLQGDGAYRDPVPLPDGRLLVAHQPGPFDPSDPKATFTPRLELLTLVERPDSSGPAVAATTVLIEEQGVALTDPEPISVRAPVRPDGAPLPPNDAETALLTHQGLPMIDALLSNLPPSGKKQPRTDIAYVRLVEHLPMTRAERTAVPPGETLFGAEDATTTALGSHGPARILAELPVEADGSFQARVPVDVPFRVQPLDASRMAIGVMHNRWFYTLPGQVLTQGLSVASGMERYGSSCAACHGDPNGVGGRPPALEEPDAITGASLSLSRFEGQNPRRPLAPPVLGAATRVEVDFTRDVQPILDRRCVGCHAGSDAPDGLDLTGTPTAHFTQSYEHLLRGGAGSGGGRAYVDDGDGRARSSYLIERLMGVELDAPRALPAGSSRHPLAGGRSGALTDEELLVLIRWIDLGATFRGTGRAVTP